MKKVKHKKITGNTENKVEIGVAGLGNVGAELIKIISAKKSAINQKTKNQIQVVAVTAKNKNKKRSVDVKKFKWEKSPVALAKNKNIKIFVELIGGESAVKCVKVALNNKKHVVTANKALIAKYGHELAQIAEKNNCMINYEAAVAGAIPIIRTMRKTLVSDSVNKISGILNGTANYILTQMEKTGKSFDQCLKQAQKLGYAEADPTFDIDGHDTAHKLIILATLAFRTKINQNKVYVEGIRNITTEDINAAKKLGYKIKLLGIAEKINGGIECRVHPTLINLKSPIAGIDNAINAVAINTKNVGDIMMSGPGAGGKPTASAVLDDIVDVVNAGDNQFNPIMGQKKITQQKQPKITQHEGGYYIRLNIKDKPGTMANVASRMAQQNISLKSIIQDQKAQKTNSQQVIIITHKCPENKINKAIQNITNDQKIKTKYQIIRIQKIRK